MKRNKMICKVKSAFIFSMIKQFLIVQFIDGFKKKMLVNFLHICLSKLIIMSMFIVCISNRTVSIPRVIWTTELILCGFNYCWLFSGRSILQPSFNVISICKKITFSWSCKAKSVGNRKYVIRVSGIYYILCLQNILFLGTCYLGKLFDKVMILGKYIAE